MNTRKKPVIAYVEADKACDICNQPLRSSPTFYDASTARGWCWLCLFCFHRYGRGLGTGVGQEYDSQTNEKLRG
jgi:hypothetical protein